MTCIGLASQYLFSISYIVFTVIEHIVSKISSFAIIVSHKFALKVLRDLCCVF